MKKCLCMLPLAALLLTSCAPKLTAEQNEDIGKLLDGLSASKYSDENVEIFFSDFSGDGRIDMAVRPLINIDNHLTYSEEGVDFFISGEGKHGISRHCGDKDYPFSIKKYKLKSGNEVIVYSSTFLLKSGQSGNPTDKDLLASCYNILDLDDDEDESFDSSNQLFYQYADKENPEILYDPVVCNEVLDYLDIELDSSEIIRSNVYCYSVTQECYDRIFDEFMSSLTPSKELMFYLSVSRSQRKRMSMEEIIEEIVSYKPSEAAQK